jgi:hypothetical protein
VRDEESEWSLLSLCVCGCVAVDDDSTKDFFFVVVDVDGLDIPKCNQLSYIKMLRINLGNLIDPFPCLLLWRRSPSTAPLTYGTSSAKHPGHDQGVTERLGEPGIGAHDC